MKDPFLIGTKCFSVVHGDTQTIHLDNRGEDCECELVPFVTLKQLNAIDQIALEEVLVNFLLDFRRDPIKPGKDSIKRKQTRTQVRGLLQSFWVIPKS